ncbi:Type 1 glutamine amidotransferase-like domain-containing protein [Candidatus Saccharibacteria bacterium]|nr:Type 1 glutamine amidotransferase-like domain-containing protein [Candidatus Saccharibacteria bacterium]
MRAILASSGFNAPETVQKCIQFVDKPAAEINFAIINEAMIVEPGDHRWFFEDIDGIRNNFGGKIELVDIQALDINETEKRLKNADVIFVTGGNTDYLATVFEKTGFIKILSKLLKTKVYVGSSAGSCVLGHRPSHKTFTDVYMEAQYTDKYPELLDIEILPHLHNPYFNTKDGNWIIEDSRVAKVPVYVISDEAAVVVNDNEISLIGKDYLKLEKGEIVERG